MMQDRYNMLKEQMSQSQEGCSEPPTMDERQLWYKVVEEEKKRKVYGVGSQTSAFYPQSSYESSSATSSRMHSETLEDELQ